MADQSNQFRTEQFMDMNEQTDMASDAKTKVSDRDFWDESSIYSIIRQDMQLRI